MSRFQPGRFFKRDKKARPGTALVPVASTPIALPANPNAERLVKRFLAGRSAETLRAYTRDLAELAKWEGVDTPGLAISRLVGMRRGEANEHIHAWRADMLDANLSPATINRRLSAVRSITGLARTFEMIDWELEVEGVQNQPYRDTSGPGTDGVTAIRRQAAEHESPAKAARDVAIARVLHDMALRRAEVARLDWPKHVNLRTAKLTIRGKGRKQDQLVTIPLQTLEALKAWLKERGKEPGPLFLNFDRSRKGDGRLTGHGIWRVITRLGKDVGIVARPHGFRHTAITTALDKTKGDVRAARRFSRHKRVETLLIYDDNREDLGGEIAAQVADTLED